MEKVETEETINVFEEKKEQMENMNETMPKTENASVETGNKITPDTELTQEQGIGVLIQAVRIGQKAGVYEIEDAEIISKAIRLFLKKN